MKKSTRRIVRMHGWRLDRALHNYIYFAFYDLYVKYFLRLGKWVARRLGGFRVSSIPFKMVFDRYHAKVLTTEDAGKLLTLEEDVDLGADRSEKIIPFHHANKVILSEPDYIAVMDCPCRLSRENPCQPLDVCLAVGKMTADFWMEHGEKYHARRVSQEEALEIVRAGRDRGEITTAWFKVATGGRTGVICSCCSCCCGALEGMRIAQSTRAGRDLSNIVASGYVAVADPGKCDACGECVDACMFGARILEGETVSTDRELCMGCGICQAKCPTGAVTMRLDPEKGLPLDLDLARERLGRRPAGG